MRRTAHFLDLASLQGLKGKCSQLSPSPPAPASHQGQSGAKSPWIWLSRVQKCHLGQMPAPSFQLEVSAPFSELPEPFILVSASKTHVAANLVTWLGCFLLVSRIWVIYPHTPFSTPTSCAYLAVFVGITVHRSRRVCVLSFQLRWQGGLLLPLTGLHPSRS